MIKSVKSFCNEKRPLVSLVLIWSIVFLLVLMYISHTTQQISYDYQGIRYQAGSHEIVEPANVKVNGRYVTTLFGKPKKFNGTIVIDNHTFDYSTHPLKFNKSNFAFLYLNRHYGNLYISNNFQSLTVQVYEKNQQGGSWSSNGGWLISAPANNRKEAVKVSNKLFQKMDWMSMIIE
ncbi:MAG: hypothetical protein JJT76_10915 [Clostridiaceae bacterium]|nr:hypothetical protein [Clostridiaceae bacterium]